MGCQQAVELQFSMAAAIGQELGLRRLLGCSVIGGL